MQEKYNSFRLPKNDCITFLFVSSYFSVVALLAGLILNGEFFFLFHGMRFQNARQCLRRNFTFSLFEQWSWNEEAIRNSRNITFPETLTIDQSKSSHNIISTIKRFSFWSPLNSCVFSASGWNGLIITTIQEQDLPDLSLSIKPIQLNWAGTLAPWPTGGGWRRATWALSTPAWGHPTASGRAGT